LPEAGLPDSRFAGAGVKIQYNNNENILLSAEKLGRSTVI